MRENSIFKLIIFAIMAVLFLGGCEKNINSFEDVYSNHPKIVKLKKMKTGLKVIHTPNPVKAIRGGRSGYKYTWPYTTSVQSLSGKVKIIEFGAFSYANGKWYFLTYTGKVFTPKNFEDWYECKDAVVTEKGCTDVNNWTGGSALRPSFGFWYYIGINKDNEKVKGIAFIRELPKLRSQK